METLTVIQILHSESTTRLPESRHHKGFTEVCQSYEAFGREFPVILSLCRVRRSSLTPRCRRLFRQRVPSRSNSSISSEVSFFTTQSRGSPLSKRFNTRGSVRARSTTARKRRNSAWTACERRLHMQQLQDGPREKLVVDLCLSMDGPKMINSKLRIRQ